MWHAVAYLSVYVCVCFCSWLDNRIRKKVTSRRKHDRVLVAVVGAAVMGDAEIESRIAEYESLLVRGQIPPAALLSVTHAVELIYEVWRISAVCRVVSVLAD